VVVTVPHALLRAGHLKFEPDLPAIDAALAKLEAGQVYKVMMRFREAFWTEPGFMKQRMARTTRAPAPLNFVHANDEDVPTWWTSEPLRDPVLTGWAGGPKAESMLGEPEGRRIDRAIHSLSAALAVPRREIETGLEGWLSHDWRADPWSGAAYSYAGVGGLNAHRVLARPIARTICFAGESTSAEETGTVSGALATGRRAARQVAQMTPE
jgi:monoamine oxidase